MNMNAGKPAKGSRAKPSPSTRGWHYTRVVGVADVIDGVAELDEAPGTCAGCRRSFKEHTDEQLYACAAIHAPTQDAVV
jgi:hypothetical protein